MLPATVINGQLQASSAAKPAEMLLQHPVGPYTTALMTAGLCVEAWQQHTLRLAQAVLRLHQLDGGSFKRLVASLQVCARPQCPKSCLRLSACLVHCSECLTTQPFDASPAHRRITAQRRSCRGTWMRDYELSWQRLRLLMPPAQPSQSSCAHLHPPQGVPSGTRSCWGP
jgi:hypothetical protein